MSTNSPLIIVISAPSGTGKTTIVKELINTNENLIASVSYTTRKKRANEVDGKDYNFISSELFCSTDISLDFVGVGKSLIDTEEVASTTSC